MANAISVPAGTPIACRLDPKRTDGKPYTPPSPPAWSSSDPAVATVTPAPDGLSAVINTVAPGTATVSVKDAAGGLSESGVVTVLPAAPASLGLTFAPNAEPAAPG